ncbi:acyl-CoA dehydrogenase family protein [soil metagenome]
MEHIEKIQKICADVVAPGASRHDKEGSFSTEAIEALSASGLMGLMVSKDLGGMGLGPRALAAVVSTLAEADASVAMVYLMHVLGATSIQTGGASFAPILKDVAAGKHLSTLAFSEAGSRSHFWAPVSKAEKVENGIRLTARKSWVTSAGHAHSYVVSAQSFDATAPTESTLWLVKKGTPGLSVAAPWDGMGLRANDSSPMTLEGVSLTEADRLTADKTGFKTMLEVVLPLFNLGSAAVALGLCRAAVGATATHLRTAQFEHIGGQKLGEALPNLRAQLAEMQIRTDLLGALVDDLVNHLETPNDRTVLRVLEAKAAGGETAIFVTSLAMRTCGGAAFSKHTSVERIFRDAHAGAVMAPTADVLRELIGRALLGMPLF